MLPYMMATFLRSIHTQSQPNCEDICRKLKNFSPTCTIFLEIVFECERLWSSTYICAHTIIICDMMQPQLRDRLQALPWLDAHKCTGARVSCQLQFIGAAFLDHLWMNFLEMSVTMHKFAIICSFHCKKTQILWLPLCSLYCSSGKYCTFQLLDLTTINNDIWIKKFAQLNIDNWYL